MTSLAPKKLLIPGLAILAVIIAYAVYSSSNADSNSAEMSTPIAETTVETTETYRNYK